MPKISVVVPIYNVEKYLRQCLDSIVNQTLKDIEIILVDDGSPDNCPEICDEYASKDNRIKVIHKENGGLGSAYNLGIEKATGEYIGLVESDDWIEPDMYEKLYSKITKKDADIIKCDFYSYDSYRTPSSLPYEHGNANLQNIYEEDKLFSVDDAPLILAYHSSLWAALYKADFLKQFKFQDFPGAAYPDFPFMFKLYLATNRIMLTYDKFNHYRMEENQDSSTKKPGKGALRILEQCENVKQFLREKKVLEKYAEPYYYHASKCCAGFFYSIADDYKNDFYDKMRDFYKDFPKNFVFQYFEPGLKCFVVNVLKNKKDLLFENKRSLKSRIIQILSCTIPNKKIRRSFRKKFM